MAEPVTRFEDLQAARTADSQQVNREAAVRQALGYLNPRNDDNQQGYVEILRRLGAAIALELEKIG